MRSGLLLTVIAACLGLSLATAAANPYSLNCKSSDGEPPAYDVVVVDLERMTVSWVKDIYIIDKITDHYITALRSEEAIKDDVGKEVLVIDRVSGEFMHTLIGLFCKDTTCRGGNMVLRSFIFSGKCVKPIF